MKAISIHTFGGPKVLQLAEVARLVLAAGKILINVYAGGVNLVGCIVWEGGNNALRAFLALPLTPGWDAAGVAEEIGSAVTTFKKGNAMYNEPSFPGNGSYAEYCTAKAS